MSDTNFVNEYGERFELRMINSEVGIMKGDETEWNDVYLVNGYGMDFNIFGSDEIEWLSRCFDMSPSMPRISTGGSSKKGWTSCIKVNESNSIDWICPVCLNVSDDDEFESHHVIEAMFGGSDGYPNVIRICKDCHALVTRGKKKSLYSLRLTLLYHQLYHFGYDFFFCQRYGNRRYKDRHIKTYESGMWELMKNFCREYGKIYLSSGEKLDFDNLRNSKLNQDLMNAVYVMRSYKDECKLKYHFFRQVVMGIIPWDYVSQVIDKRSKEIESARAEGLI